MWIPKKKSLDVNAHQNFKSRASCVGCPLTGFACTNTPSIYMVMLSKLARCAWCFLSEIDFYAPKLLPAPWWGLCRLQSPRGVRWQSRLLRTCTQTFGRSCSGNYRCHYHRGCLGLLSQRGALRVTPITRRDWTSPGFRGGGWCSCTGIHPVKIVSLPRRCYPTPSRAAAACCLHVAPNNVRCVALFDWTEVRKIRNEASSCPGIFSSNLNTLNFDILTAVD